MTQHAFCAPLAFPMRFNLRRLRPRANRFTTMIAPAVPKTAVAEEHFDILKPDGTPAGYSKPRSLVHKNGYLHRSTHMWVLSNDGRVLLQKRSQLKDTFPGRWDVSAAGHISAGDYSRPSALRELEEELGLYLDNPSELKYIMSCTGMERGSTERHGSFVDNEIQDIYVYVAKETIPIERFTLQAEEVDMVEYWNVHDYLNAIRNGDQSFVPRSQNYLNTFFPWLEEHISAME